MLLMFPRHFVALHFRWVGHQRNRWHTEVVEADHVVEADDDDAMAAIDSR
jgi:hypothetical protein